MRNRTGMRSWRIPSLLRYFFALPVAVALTMAAASGDADEQSGTGRAKTSFDAALVRAAVQTMDRLRAIHSFGNHPQIAKPRGFSRPLAAERPVERRQSRRSVRGLSPSSLCRQPPELILAIGAPAANFVQRYRERIFPGTPMLFTAVEARRVQYDKLTQDDTVVAVAHDFPASFENILRVLPRTKTIAIVNGTSPNETFWLGELRRETAPLAGRVALKFYNGLSFEDILKDAANLPPDSAIFFHLMNVDAAGVAHEA